MHEAGAMIGSLTYAVVAEALTQKKAFLYSMLAHLWQDNKEFEQPNSFDSGI